MSVIKKVLDKKNEEQTLRKDFINAINSVIDEEIKEIETYFTQFKKGSVTRGEHRGALVITTDDKKEHYLMLSAENKYPHRIVVISNEVFIGDYRINDVEKSKNATRAAIERLLEEVIK
jgi:hypothetical protein